MGSVAGNAKYNKDGSVESYTAANFVAGKGTVAQRDVIVAADDFAIRGGHADGAVWGKSVCSANKIIKGYWTYSYNLQSFMLNNWLAN